MVQTMCEMQCVVLDSYHIDEKYTMNDDVFFFYYFHVLFFALVEFFNLILILHKIIAIFCTAEETMDGGFAADAEERTPMRVPCLMFETVLGCNGMVREMLWGGKQMGCKWVVHCFIVYWFTMRKYEPKQVAQLVSLLDFTGTSKVTNLLIKIKCNHVQNI